MNNPGPSFVAPSPASTRIVSPSQPSLSSTSSSHTSTVPTPHNPPSKSNSGTPVAAIAGATAGTLAVLILAIAFCLVFRRRRRAKAAARVSPTSSLRHDIEQPPIPGSTGKDLLQTRSANNLEEDPTSSHRFSHFSSQVKTESDTVISRASTEPLALSSLSCEGSGAVDKSVGLSHNGSLSTIIEKTCSNNSTVDDNNNNTLIAPGTPVTPIPSSRSARSTVTATAPLTPTHVSSSSITATTIPAIAVQTIASERGTSLDLNSKKSYRSGRTSAASQHRTETAVHIDMLHVDLDELMPVIISDEIQPLKTPGRRSTSTDSPATADSRRQSISFLPQTPTLPSKTSTRPLSQLQRPSLISGSGGSGRNRDSLVRTSICLPNTPPPPSQPLPTLPTDTDSRTSSPTEGHRSRASIEPVRRHSFRSARPSLHERRASTASIKSLSSTCPMHGDPNSVPYPQGTGIESEQLPWDGAMNDVAAQHRQANSGVGVAVPPAIGLKDARRKSLVGTKPRSTAPRPPSTATLTLSSSSSPTWPVQAPSSPSPAPLPQPPQPRSRRRQSQVQALNSGLFTHSDRSTISPPLSPLTVQIPRRISRSYQPGASGSTPTVSTSGGSGSTAGAGAGAAVMAGMGQPGMGGLRSTDYSASSLPDSPTTGTSPSLNWTTSVRSLSHQQQQQQQPISSASLPRGARQTPSPSLSERTRRPTTSLVAVPAHTSYLVLKRPTTAITSPPAAAIIPSAPVTLGAMRGESPSPNHSLGGSTRPTSKAGMMFTSRTKSGHGSIRPRSQRRSISYDESWFVDPSSLAPSPSPTLPPGINSGGGSGRSSSSGSSSVEADTEVSAIIADALAITAARSAAMEVATRQSTALFRHHTPSPPKRQHHQYLQRQSHSQPGSRSWSPYDETQGSTAASLA